MSNSGSLNEDDLRSILDGMVEGIITINHKGIILSFNKSAETIFGYETHEVIGKNVKILMPDPDRGHHDEYLERYMSTGDAHIVGIGRKVTAMHKSGNTFPLHLSISEYPSKVEGERWFIGSCLDITLQKQQEEQLARSSKMEAIGNLSGGIAHDFNNMLGVIMGYTEILQDELKGSPQQLKYLEQVYHAAKRGADLTKSLLGFSSHKPDNEEVIIINDALNNNYKMLSKLLTANISLEMNLGEDLWPVSINVGCLEDAVLNMSINAMHAMPEGGKIEYKTANVHIGGIDAQLLNLKKGDYVKLSISDTGIGMTKEVSSRIFEPFYTTKGNKGTGLGLSQVYSFVTNYGGTIRLYSEMGHGTCFSIYLPRYHEITEKNDIDEQLIPADKITPATGNILVVDDEIAIKELNAQILSTAGYTVHTAETGNQALSILDNNDIDLVLSDVIMPEMDGYELAHMVHHKYPDIKVQLCSGFSSNKGKTVTDEELSNNLLTKPFTQKELLERVNELLNDKS